MRLVFLILLIVGMLLIVSSFLVNLNFVGKILTQDGNVDNILVINYFWIFKLFLFLFGLLLILNKFYLEKIINFIFKNKKELLLFLSILIICLIAVELISGNIVKYHYTSLAFKDKNLFYNNTEYSIGASFNSLGFRDEEFNISKKYRIAIVGDSYVFGDGVEKNQTFEDLLENQLKQKYDDVAVYNLGVSGTDLEEYSDRVDGFIPILKPNITILSLYLQNDITCKKESAFKKIFFPNTIKILKEYFLSLSYKSLEDSIIINSKLEETYKNYLKSGLINPTLVIQAITHPNITENHKIVQQWFENCKINKDLILKIKKYAEEHNSRLIILLIPPNYQVSSENWKYLNDLGYLTDDDLLQDTTLQKSILNFCSQQKIDCIDLLPELKNSKQFPYFNLDPHFNRIGHEITSKVLFNMI